MFTFSVKNSAKNYQNQSMYVKVIASERWYIFRHKSTASKHTCKANKWKN